MILYRSATRRVHPRDVLAGAGDARRFLIEFGEIEAALADRICESADRVTDEITAMREVSMDAARQVLCRAGFQPALPPWLQESIEISVPEGYAWYALTPDSYIAPVRRFHAERQPREVVCIGIRSIGTSLSAVVAATLEQCGCAVRSYTVRPRGHPFDRQLTLAPELAREWRCASAHFAIVDEGPGLSGSSFASVARALASLGVPESHIVFFPGHDADPARFVSESARREWARHAKYPAEPPVPKGTTFAGLGRYGEEKWTRLRALADAGFTPAPLALEEGWLTNEFVPSTPVTAAAADGGLIETMARYAAFRAREFRTGRMTDAAPLAEMLRHNLGIDRALPEPAPEVITDGCMLPEKWIATARGYLKLDAADHGDNHFLPGPTDICWDLAGAAAEFKLAGACRQRLVRRYAVLSGDRTAEARFPFFCDAYRAFCCGREHYERRAMAS